MKIGLAIDQLRAAEAELASELVKAGQRHKADHDVYHLSKLLAGFEREHIEALAPFADRYGAGNGGPLTDVLRRGSEQLLGRVREKGSELMGRRPEAGLLLLRDLRRLHLLASKASIDWVLLGQAAQAARDAELLGTVSHCHAETLRTLKWTTYRLKEASPQVLMT